MADRIWIVITSIMPKSLVYWCTVRVLVYSTTGKYANQVVGDLTVAEALTRWYKDRMTNG